jgi:pre-mRNA-processing factor 40
MFFSGQAPPTAVPTSSTVSVTWTQHVAPDGRVYFYNEKTKESSWEKPEELKSRNERLLSQCPWKEYQTDAGKTYFHNVITKESAWSIPKELQDLKDKVEAEKNDSTEVSGPVSRIQLPPEELSVSPDDSSMQSVSNEDSKTSTALSIESSDVKMSKESAEQSPLTSNGLSNGSSKTFASQPIASAASSSQSAATTPSQSKDLMDIFRELLREKNVSSNVSWEVALKSISSDGRYELFRHHPERKQMFNAYKTQKAKEEREEQRNKARRARENLEKHLQTSKLMNASVKWRSACEMFRDNEHWKAVPEADRREIFEDAIKVLAEREREEAKSLRKRNMRVLSDVLDSMPSITQRISWQQAQRLLLDNPVFSEDAALLGMDKEDALAVFETHIRQLEADEEEERRRERKRTARQQRKHREQFLDLLEELKNSGKLTSTSKWCSLYSEISADARFAPMLSNALSGSTPLDLFKCYVHELRIRYERDRSLIKQIVADQKLEVTIDSKLNWFVSKLSADSKSADLDLANVKIIFERFLEKARDAEREQQKSVSRQKRKHELLLLSAMTRLQPQIDEQTTWDQVESQLQEDVTWSQLPDDGQKAVLFDQLRNRLLESCAHHHGRTRKPRSNKKTKKTRCHSSDSANSADEADTAIVDEIRSSASTEGKFLTRFKRPF